MNLLEPLPMSVDDALRKPPVQPQGGRTGRQALLAGLGCLQRCVEFVEVFLERIKARQQFPPIGVLATQWGPIRVV